MIVFSNKGEIDVRLITTLGLNVKDESHGSPIGYFGTGLKYAIAVLLREGQNITILSGLRRYTFKTEMETVRGKDFTFIYMEGTGRGEADSCERLGFTTDLGKNWGLEQAYRELHCNATDEGGKGGQRCEGSPQPAPGYTKILVEGEQFEAVYVRRDEFILNVLIHPLVWCNEHCEARAGKSRFVFYKGIRIFTSNRELAYTYNVHGGNLKLSEDRTAGQWEVDYYIAELLGAPNTPYEHLTSAMHDEDGYEYRLDFGHVTQTAGFTANLARLAKERPEHMNDSLVKIFYRKLGAKVDYEPHKMSVKEQVQLSNAIEFVKAIGFNLDKFPIKVVTGLGENVHGKAVDGTIYLTPWLFTNDLLRPVLIEEFIHLYNHVGDFTRELQNVLFGHIVRLGEQLTPQQVPEEKPNEEIPF